MKLAGATGDLRLKRILVLHKQFRTGKSFSAEALVSACQEVDPEATPKRIRSDLKFLRDELQAPLPSTKTNKHKGYYYVHAFSLFEGLSDTYSGNLSEVLALVRQMAKSRDEFSGLEDLLLRLEQRANRLGAESNQAILFESSVYSGQKHLIPLYQAINVKIFLRINYQPFPIEASYSRHIFPLLLKEYNQRWFLIAQEAGKASIQILALDRILDCRETKVPFPLVHTLPSNYFDTLVGVSREKDGTGVEKVILSVKKSRLNYLITKKIHSSQEEIVLPDGSAIVTLFVELNRELTSLLLSFGADINVLEPSVLRLRVAEQHRMAWEQYNNSQVSRLNTEI